MKTYRVTIEYHYAETFQVQAETPEEAIEKAPDAPTWDTQDLDGDGDILFTEEVA